MMSDEPGARADGSSVRYAAPPSIQRTPPNGLPATSCAGEMRRSLALADSGSRAAAARDNRVTAQNNANHERRIRSLQSTAVQREDAAPRELRNRRSGGMVVVDKAPSTGTPIGRHTS